MKLPIFALFLLFACAPRTTPSTTLAPTPTVAAPVSVPEPSAPRHYAGTIALPGVEVPFSLALRKDGETWTGRIDIPVQRLYDAKLDGIVVERDRIEFGLEKLGVRFTVTMDAEGDPDECTLAQAGHSFPCGLSTIDEARWTELTTPVPPKRPQTPKPPFPYDAIEVEYENAAAGIRLAGTLTIPNGEGPYPAVLLVTGSGAQDRDETLFDHKPFLVIADHLARHGIATLRVDDRGVGGSGGDPKTSTTLDFVGDALAGVEFLRTQPRIDARRIGIAGHSEGGIVAPAAAVQSRDVAFVVMLAGTGVPSSEVVLDQIATLHRAAGKADEQIDSIVAGHRELFELVRTGASEELLRSKLVGLLGADASTEMVDAQLSIFSSPWYRAFITYDPRPTLQKLAVPVLVLQGELDTQVRAELNVPSIVAALKKARNRRVKVHRLAGLNHLFQHAKTGMVDEYATIEETMSSEVLTILSDWIGQQATGRSRPRS